MENGTGLLRDIGTPETLWAEARSGAAPTELKANAHIHLPPNFSAFDTVAEAVGRGAAEGLRVLGASNYYDYSVYREFAAQAQTQGLFPIFGLEIISRIEDLAQAGIKINDPGNPGKMYLCGKGIGRFDPMSEEARQLLDVIRGNDSERMAQMVTRMAEHFASQGLETGLDAEVIKGTIAQRHDCPVETVYLQERHIAQAFQEALFERVPVSEREGILARLFSVPSKAAPDDASAIQGEIRSHLMKAGKPAFIEETFVGFDHTYKLILALGGIPCYPTLADGTSPICPYEASLDTWIADLRVRGVYSAEFIPVRNTPEVLGEYVRALRSAGFVVTAGTEHNTLDPLPLIPTCLKGQPIPEDIAAIFREGVCVVVAHQYLTLQGLPGFVDARGRLNPDYVTDDERITAFAALGAAVLERFAASTIES